MKETFLPLFAYLENRSFFHKILDLIIVFIASFFIASAWVFANYYTEIWRIFEKSHVESVIERNTIFNDRLEPILDNIRIQSNSPMVAFFRYHNGFVGTTGFPFIRKTATNISTNNDSLQEQFLISFTALPTSADISQLEKHRNDECLFRDVNTSLPFYFTHYDLGFQSYYTCPVFDANNFLVGYIGVHWLQKYTMNSELEVIVQQAAEEIGILDTVL